MGRRPAGRCNPCWPPNNPAPGCTGCPSPSTPAETATAPLGQLTKVRDWLAGRDKESDSSLAAYRRLADDITSALPEEFSPAPVTPAMIEWFWRHNTGAAPTPHHSPAHDDHELDFACSAIRRR